jgi:hypothetical protein
MRYLIAFWEIDSMGYLDLGFGVSKLISLSIVVSWMATRMHVVMTIGGKVLPTHLLECVKW